MPHQQDNRSWRNNRDDFPRYSNRPSTHNGSEQHNDSNLPSTSNANHVPYRRQFNPNEYRSNSRSDEFDSSDSRVNPRLDKYGSRDRHKAGPSHWNGRDPSYNPRDDQFNARELKHNKRREDQFSSSDSRYNEPPDQFNPNYSRSNTRSGRYSANEPRTNPRTEPFYSSKSRFNLRADQLNSNDYGHDRRRDQFNGNDSKYSTQEDRFNLNEPNYNSQEDQSNSGQSRYSGEDSFNLKESRFNERSDHFYSKDSRYNSRSGPHNSRDSKYRAQTDQSYGNAARYNPQGNESYFSESRHDSRRNESYSNKPRYHAQVGQYDQDEFGYNQPANEYCSNKSTHHSRGDEFYGNESRYGAPRDRFNSGKSRYNQQANGSNSREFQNKSQVEQFNSGESGSNSRSDQFNACESRLNPQADQFDPRKSRLNPRANQFNPSNSRLNPQADQFNPNEPRFKSATESNDPSNKDNQNDQARWSRLKKQLNGDNQDDLSQRSRLTEQLNRGSLECLVCTEYVRQADKVWNCTACYNVFHLKCIIKWSDSSKSEAGWRCPACQNVTSKTPQDYICFCGKSKLTCGWNRMDNAHSCGEMCGRTQKVEPFYKPCVHSCTLLCHPGPCPTCSVMVTRECGCGRTSQPVQCCSKTVIACDSLCSKPLNCGEHYCQQPCHFDKCQPCSESYEEVCFCGKVTKTITCGTMPSKNTHFSCGKLCNSILNCKTHKCKRVCHEDACEPCKFLPDLAKTCWCGKTPLTEEQLGSRESCVDPLPTCDATCGKAFSCGPSENKHSCLKKCHENTCPSCSLKTVVKCRCGSMSKEVNCAQLNTKAAKFQCTKRCTKKRSCGKHKCNQNCCIDTEHICPSVCNRRLTCGQHLCEMLCHPGNCPPCSNISFEELTCHCQQTVMFPPIPCGARPPKCNGPCLRQHECEHETMHNCHSGTTCPPCPVLTTKKCFGGHETRNTIPCHQKEFSCGLPCNKPLPCKTHRCIQPCHQGSCTKKGKSCNQPCPKPRALCSHPCGQSCHSGSCPDKPCREMVKVSCQCGHRTSSAPCFENNAEYEKIISTQVVPKSSNLQFGGVVMELGNVTYGVDAKQLTVKKLECNAECEVIERNRKLALGLQIRNPDLSAKLAPRYSEFMMQWAKKDPQFCQRVHEKLVDLVQLAKQSKQKTRSFSFEVMNRPKRQLVHEYCEHFGVESVSYDAEPKRNVVATASKDTSWIPSYSLMEVVQRQNGQRKIHVPNQSTMKNTTSKKNEMQALKPVNQTSCWTLLTKPELVEPASTSRKHKKPDYFNDDL